LTALLLAASAPGLAAETARTQDTGSEQTAKPQAQAAAPKSPAPVKVMVLGTYHMANPGKDLHNAEIADVTTPGRQKELEALADALASFAPDKVGVERQSDRGDLSLSAYEAFTPEDLKEKRNETVQIGFRLAHRLEHKAVYGIDEKSEEKSYFPFDRVSAYIEENGLEAGFARINEAPGGYSRMQERAQDSKTVAGMLSWINQPGLIARMHRNWYYALLNYADGTDQPGALLNARWYERNAKIFSKIAHISEPGERLVVVFGSGHAYWLRHLVAETPGYSLVEPSTYLEAVAHDRRRERGEDGTSGE